MLTVSRLDPLSTERGQEASKAVHDSTRRRVEVAGLAIKLNKATGLVSGSRLAQKETGLTHLQHM